MMSEPIELPDTPRHEEFEDFVAAYFNSSQFYVDKRLIMRQKAEGDISEILELDLFVTDYNSNPPDTRLIEAKSGDWSMRDIFAVRGWMDFLGLDKAALVYTGKKTMTEAHSRVGDQISVKLIQILDFDNAEESLRALGLNTNIDPADTTMWRYAHWVEQSIIELIKKKKKSHKETERFKVMDNYIDEINNRTFFSARILDRAQRLYSFYRNNPRLSSKVAHESLGDAFGAEYSDIPSTLFSDTFYDCKLTDLQLSTYVEHRARLAVLKSLVDFCVWEKAGDSVKTNTKRKLLGMDVDVRSWLPQNYLDALEQIKNEQYCHLYAVFWQWFLWVFGGFILMDRIEEEYEILADKTGIPLGHIDEAFRAYERLFENPNGWFKTTNANVRVLKMFSVPFMGVGANYRRVKYASGSEFGNLKFDNEYTLRDLIRWNNLACDVLRKSSRYRNCAKFV